MVNLNFNATNNIVEHDALTFGLSTALSLGVQQLLVKGDSQLVIKQVKGECSCHDTQLAAYLFHMQKLEKDFEVLDLQHVPRANNEVADELSTKASTWAPVPDGVFKQKLQQCTAQPVELGKGGETSTPKLAVPAACWRP
jgi:ribonuclease HI